ncbi:hypothetical protein FNF29_02423 [Cafeteria roenbergensis]|uniref:RanBP2-type domain-containing protein n=1 Tax=Cafeteria roenbergensis TaxID=33653 RepID=A0A5A8CN81_CAFRO|nr:hypothetical protein FNF29_02423 [Cafeteria roenbergensis]|eukprot:KAA0154546.1 hypothetical protein FNF29_02423 [Cafeteria roenbergensis]
MASHAASDGAPAPGSSGYAFQAALDRAKSQWQCPGCKAMNEMFELVCPACERPKPGSKPASEQAAAPSGGAFAGDPFASSSGGGSSSSGAFAGNPFGSAAAPAPANPFGQDPFAAAAAVPATTPFAGDPFKAAAAASANAASAASEPDKPVADPTTFFEKIAPLVLGEDGAEEASEAEVASVRAMRIHAPAALDTAVAKPVLRTRRAARTKGGSKAAATAASSAAEKKKQAAAAKKATAQPDSEDAVEPGLPSQLWMWGSGECSQMPIPEEELDEGLTVEPVLAKQMAGRRVVQVAAGALHTLVLTEGGAVWSWGCNDDKVLGRPGAENVPTRVKPFGPEVKAVAIGTGSSHAAALDSTGAVWVWGTYKGREGRLGFTEEMKWAEVPVQMTFPEKHGRVVRLSCGFDHTAAVTEGGGLLTWGCGEIGQLGHPITQVRMRGNRQRAIGLRVHEVRVSAREEDATGRVRKGAVAVDNVFAGGDGLWVVTRRGTVLTSGLNCFGQLGIGDLEDRDTLTQVPELSGQGVVQIVAGGHHSLVLTEAGHVYAMGRGDSGQLGISPAGSKLPAPNSVSLEPRRVTLPEGKRAVQVAANSSISAAVCADGSVFVWGTGSAGQTGSAELDDAAVPNLIATAKFGGKRVVQVSCGGQHMAAITAEAATPVAAGAAAAAGSSREGSSSASGAASATKPAPSAKSGVTPSAKRSRRA